MNRTSLSTGIILPALLALLPGCDDPFTCPGSFQECSTGVCVDIMASDDHCGACGETCDTDQHCEAGACVPDLVCTAPEQSCGDACVDVATSVEHCGACDDPCPGAYDDCVGGECAAPILAIQTYSEQSKGPPIERDLYVLRDLTYALTRLNDTTFAAPRVIDHAILPDGRVLLVAAQTEDVYELFVASPRGGALTRVSAPMPADGDVLRGLAVSRDGSKVLYRADADTDDVVELYAVSLAAPGVAVKVNATMVAGGNVSRVFALSADGRRAAYIADADTDALDELYTVDLSAATPGSPLKLNPPTTTDHVWDFEMSPDGTRVVYRAQEQASGEIELHVVRVATPGTTDPIGYAESGGGHVDGYHLSPDGNALAFTASASYLEESLWYVDLTAAPPYDATRLADGTYEDPNWKWVNNDFAFTADGARIVFRQVGDAFSFDRLYAVSVTTPASIVQLSAEGTTSAEQVGDFALSPDGTAVVFRGGADGAEGGDVYPRTEERDFVERFGDALYHVDLTAATPAPNLITTPPMIGHDGVAGGYVFTRDGGRVAYRADEDVSGRLDAYLVTPATADAARNVSPPLDQTTDATDVFSLSRF